MSAGIESGRRRTGPAAQPRRIRLTLLRRHWQISKNLMTSTGTFYGQRAIMEGIFIRFNSGTAYYRNLIGNTDALERNAWTLECVTGQV